MILAIATRWLLPQLSMFLMLQLFGGSETFSFVAPVDAIQLKTTSSRLQLLSINNNKVVGGGGVVVVPNTNTKTKTNIIAQQQQQSPLQDFIARPIHWPEIVLSSNRVEVIKKKEEQKQASPLNAFFRTILPNNNNNNNKNKTSKSTTGGGVSPASSSSTTTAADATDLTNTNTPLQVGDTVIEYFALNQFKVEWTCTKNEPGRLVVVSPDGVKGIATNCVMDFEFDNTVVIIENDDDDDDAIDDETKTETVVRLTMEYTPESPLAVLATPALVVDNWLALNVLLPAAIDRTPLDSFRKLMGILYGIAGVAHFLDLMVGGSQLFTTVIGIPSFENLDFLGQLYSLIWCASGPIAYGLSIATTAADTTSTTTADASIDDNKPIIMILNNINKADIGLVLYGIVEIVGAALSSGISGAPASDALYNAGGVQAIVLAAWFYSYQKQQQQRQQQIFKANSVAR